jgi:hypothetical protein
MQKICFGLGARMVCGLWALSLFGCSESNLQPLAGKIKYVGDSGFAFSGDVVELRSQSDPTSNAYGEIQPDGSFEVDSLEKGKIVKGAKPGKYAVRLVIADDDYDHKKLASKAINKKYFSFDTSGLEVDVPATNVNFSITR